MKSNTNSGNTAEPFDEKTTRQFYQKATRKNDDRRKGVVNVDEFAKSYVNEERAFLNRAIWNRNLPVECPEGEKQYRTIEEAYAKLIYDAEFYLGSWKKVKEVARRSPYLTQF